jgi:TolB protein
MRAARRIMRAGVARGFLIVLVALGAAGAIHAASRADAFRIEFLRGDKRVWVMNGDGSDQHVATPNGYAWWSPDGRRIALSVAGRDHPRLYIANNDGTKRRKVADTYPGGDCWEPQWDPSGDKMTFDAGCEIDVTDLFVVRRDGTRRRRLARRLWTLTPRWSPDGREILFAGSPSPHNNYGLYLTTPGGRPAKRISGVAFEFQYNIDWRWSPDGRSIFLLAETQDGSNRGFELSALPSDGGELHQLTPAELNVYAFDVSPDGQRIVLQGSTGMRDWEIYVINADGTDLEQLTDNRSQDRRPLWSPDGRSILFTSERDGNYEIYVMGADGTGETNLSQNPADDYYASWIPAQ